MAEDLLPPEITDKKDLEYEVHKKKWSFSGIGGVITYQWKVSGQKYSLALMFHSPMMKSNTWNVVINSEDTVEVDQNVFKNLLKENGDNPMVKGDNNYTIREFGHLGCPGSHVLFKNRQDQPHRQVHITSRV